MGSHRVGHDWSGLAYLTLNPVNTTGISGACPGEAKGRHRSHCPVTSTLTPGGLKDSGTQLRVMSYIHHWLKRKHWNWFISPYYLTWYHMLEFLKNFSTLCNIFIRSSPLWSLKLLIMNCLCVFFFKYFLTYLLFLAVLLFVATHGLSLVALSKLYFGVAVCRLLTAVASLVAKSGL